MQAGKFLIHLVVAVVVFAVASWYFRSVAPADVAKLIALVLALIEIVAPLVGGKHGVSGLMLLRVGAPVLVFPGIAWLSIYLLHAAWYVTVPIAAGVACGVGAFAAGHGSGREHRRLISTGAAVLVPLYALVYVLIEGAPPLGLACACAAVAIAPMVVKVAVTWPGRHETVFLYATAACAVVASVWGALAVF